MMKERMKMSQIIDGKLVSKQVRERVAKETEQLKAKGITPGLAVITVLLYTSPSPRDRTRSRMPSSA